MEITVNIDNNRDGHSTLSGTDTDREQRHEEALQLSGEEHTVECSEIEIDCVQHKFD